jgi:hypothetical protein
MEVEQKTKILQMPGINCIYAIIKGTGISILTLSGEAGVKQQQN